MTQKRKIRAFAVLVLATALLPISPATGAISGLTITATSGTVQSTYGTNPPDSSIDVSFISTDANDEHVKISANMASNPAGQNVEVLLRVASNTNASIEMFSSTAHVKATAPGVVNARFSVTIRSASNNPLLAGTYSLIIYGGSTFGTQTVPISFIVSSPPAASLSAGLSKIWLAQGATPASESNNVDTLNVSSTVDTKNQIANLTVDLRDTNNAPITNLPLTVSITGPGLIGIGTSASSNVAMGRAVLGQPGFYSISVYADGLFGSGTVTVLQNGQQIGSRSINFAQATPPPASVAYSRVEISKSAVLAGDSIQVSFTSTTTSVPLGLIPLVNFFYAEECEDDCLFTATPTLISGDSSNGNWIGKVEIPTTARSGNYTLSIYFPQLKGVKDFILRVPNALAVKGVDPPPPLPPASASMSNITLSKTDLKIGESLVMKVSVKTTNFPIGIPIQATIFTANDCEEEGCSSGGVGKLISGTLQDGIWEISIPIHGQLFTGKYSVSYGFFKLKGTPGAIGVYPGLVNISGLAVPPPKINPTLEITNIEPRETSLRAGENLEVTFVLQSANLDSSQIAQVYLFGKSDEDLCEDGCGMGVAQLIKGTLEKGAWSASLTIPPNVPSGKYSLRVAFPKLKGISGSYSDYQGTLAITGGSGAGEITPVYEFSGMRISQTQVNAGQEIEGFFALKSNDPTVSSPECMVLDLVGWFKAVRLSGVSTSGSFYCKFLIPVNTRTGFYKVQAAVVGYANNNKNEEWILLGNLYVNGTNQVPKLDQNECRNLFAGNAQALNFALADTAEINRYVSNVDNFKSFFMGKNLSWYDANSYLVSISKKNLERSSIALTNVRSTNGKGCETFSEFTGRFEKLGTELDSAIRTINFQNTQISDWYRGIQLKIPDPGKHFNPKVETGSIEIQSVLEKVPGFTSVNFAYQSNNGPAKVQCTVNFGSCIILQNGSQSIDQTFYGTAEITRYTSGATITIQLLQFNTSGMQIASIQRAYATLRPGLQPTIGPVKSIAGGCTFKIQNYDTNFRWFAKSEMKVSRDGQAIISTITPTDEYLSTSREGYQTVNAINTLFRCIPLSQAGTNEQDQIIEDDGVEEEPAGELKIRKEPTGKSLMTVTSNLDTEKISLIATRKGKATIRFSALTNESGIVRIRTSRNLSGYKVKLILNGVTLSTTKVR